MNQRRSPSQSDTPRLRAKIAFIKKAVSTPHLVDEELIINIKLAKKGNVWAKNKVIRAYQKLIVTLLKNHPKLDPDEVISLGLERLEKCVKGYDLNSGITFLAYASSCLNKEVLNLYSRNPNSISVTRTHIQIYRKAIRNLQKEENNDPTDEEVAQKIREIAPHSKGAPKIMEEISVDQVKQIRVALSDHISLDQRQNGEDGINLHEYLGSNQKQIELEEKIKIEQEFIELREIYKRLSQRLSERERFILSQRVAKFTLDQIGEKLGITRERVRQIEAEAKEKLKGFYQEELAEQQVAEQTN